MNIEEIRNQVREELTRRPSDEEVNAGVRSKIVEELASKQSRVHALENELETARLSLAETESFVASLDAAPEAVEG